MDARFAKVFPALTVSDDAALKSLLSEGRILEVPASSRLFEVGMVCHNYLLVIEGSVRVQLLSESGREVTLYRVLPGESCVLTTSCLMGNNPYPAFSEAEKDVVAFAVDREHFVNALNGSPVFRRFVFDNLGHRFADVIARIEMTFLGKIDSKLAIALLNECDKDGHVRTTHQLLAVELGTAREVVSRHLKQFEHRGWVRLGRGEIRVMDRDALARRAEAVAM